MDGQNLGNNAHATQGEAKASTSTHFGPTADRYESALVRYVEAVAADRPAVSEPGGQTRLTFPPRTVSDVMTRAVVSAYEGACFKEIAAALDRNGINAVPVIDAEHKVVGIVSAADLLARVGHARPSPPHHRLSGPAASFRKEHGTTARDLMTAPVITVLPSTPIEEASRLLARFRIRSLPVVDAAGQLIGMVSRVDLIRLFLRNDEEILNDVLRDVVEATDASMHGKVRVSVSEGVVTLSGRVDTALRARGLVHRAGLVPGVLNVQDALEFDVNDTYLPR